MKLYVVIRKPKILNKMHRIENDLMMCCLWEENIHITSDAEVAKASAAKLNELYGKEFIYLACRLTDLSKERCKKDVQHN